MAAKGKNHKVIETLTFKRTNFTDLAAQKIQGWKFNNSITFQEFMQFSRLRQNSSTFQAKD